MDESIRLAVKTGINFLDDQCPGWEVLIDLNNLNMGLSDRCIIGQVIDNPDAFVEDIVSDGNDFETWAIEHGFDTPPFYSLGDINRSKMRAYYRDLEALWADEVLRRRA